MNDDETLAAALEEAWSDADADAPPEEVIQPTVDEAPAETAAEEPAAEEDLAAEASTEAPTAEVPPEEDAAPVGMPPAAREAWKDTPPAMREAIAKREADYARGIQEYAENAKRAQQMDQTLAPYRQYLAVAGDSPSQTIGSLLQTAATLQGGSPAQKATMVAQLINQFGVDISALDNVLVGNEVPAATQQQSQFEQLLDQRLAPMQQYLQSQQQAAQQQHQAAQQQTTTEVQQFAAANEFYNDVSMDMADIMDLAGNRGQNLTLKEAYDRACMLRPDIAAITNSRTAAAGAAGKQAAAVSIHGNPGGTGGAATAGSVRGALEEAWENVGRV